MPTLTYIRTQHKGYYFETTEPIDENYWAGQIGTTYEDFLEGKWVLLSDNQVKFHKDYPNASVREVFVMQLTPAPARTLESAKSGKIEQIGYYDKSDEVNCFYMNGVPMWLTVNERQQIQTQIAANQAIGRETMTRWFNDTEFTFPIATWQQMLVALEVYAGDAINVTGAHIAAVKALETIEAVDAYEYHTGYPEKLHFGEEPAGDEEPNE